jgi:hypothetical protein
VLVELGLVEPRYRAVCAVLDGATVVDVARRNGVARQTVAPGAPSTLPASSQPTPRTRTRGEPRRTRKTPNGRPGPRLDRRWAQLLTGGAGSRGHRRPAAPRGADRRRRARRRSRCSRSSGDSLAGGRHVRSDERANASRTGHAVHRGRLLPLRRHRRRVHRTRHRRQRRRQGSCPKVLAQGVCLKM